MTRWLEERASLSEDQAEELVGPLRNTWREARLRDPDGPTSVPPEMVPEGPDQDQGPASSSSSSESPPKEPERKQIRVQERAARYVVVVARLHKAGREGCWMGRKRTFRSSREFVQPPARFDYTHVCKLCWPRGDRESGSEATEGSEAATVDETSVPEASASAGQGAELLDPQVLAEQAYQLWQAANVS